MEFGRELKYLVAAETAAAVAGKGSREPVKSGQGWEGALALVLDLFDAAGRGSEGYEWLVMPSSRLADRRPLELIRDGKSREVIDEAERYLSSAAT
ncbi:MAG TPA: hypothetical protein VLC07_09210 [Solirubrobacterales bacterium]|nr:hypothetical protein [Solirubrobacterales bacterium]